MFKSKTELAKALIQGRRFQLPNSVELHYDESCVIPFRCGRTSMSHSWTCYDTVTEVYSGHDAESNEIEKVHAEIKDLRDQITANDSSIANLCDCLDRLSARVDKLESDAKEPEWPEVGDDFWYITADHDMMSSIWQDDYHDHRLRSETTLYRTRDDALKALQSLNDSPLTEPPELGATYYVPVATKEHWFFKRVWTNDAYDHRALKDDQVFLSAEGAIRRAKEMVGQEAT